jgi:demethylmenaquinone methyltransferase / 2-methoxy-6-polyprenyl-1,4-benzoquinol methylase
MRRTSGAPVVEGDTFSRRITRLLYHSRDAARGPSRVGAFLGDSQLHRMFETIGTTYDVQNHLLSVGRDRHWRRMLADLIGREPVASVVDMATGTGDVAIELARRFPSAQIAGIDYSQKMLAVAASKLAHTRNAAIRGRVRLLQADIRETGLPAEGADVVTISFALRNLEDRLPALDEFRRLLRPGGRLFIMEFALPETPIVGRAYRLYFDHLMPLAGNLLSRTDYAYTYLKESVHGFPSPPEFVSEIERSGFAGVRAVPMTFGLSTIYCARRPA